MNFMRVAGSDTFVVVTMTTAEAKVLSDDIGTALDLAGDGSHVSAEDGPALDRAMAFAQQLRKEAT